ncbi:hypothetical protein M0805_009731 [Coniferiporia weirii]|nr:hypothetical protein M0805_009731 [Coniferiporia weirii]
MACMAVFKAELHNLPDVLCWLDEMLIWLCQKFSDYMFPSVSLLFTFHLRRSQFLQKSDNEADMNNSPIMVWPTLVSSAFDVPPRPMLLNSISIKPDRILLLNFHVWIFHGEAAA